MEINPTSQTLQAFFTNKPVSKTQSDNAPQSNALASDMQKLANQYDVNNISYKEMYSLANELYNQGELSAKDSSLIISKISALEHFDNNKVNTRIDVVNIWEGTIDFKRSQPGSTGIESDVRALELFKGLQALRHSNIPNSV